MAKAHKHHPRNWQEKACRTFVAKIAKSRNLKNPGAYFNMTIISHGKKWFGKFIIMDHLGSCSRQDLPDPRAVLMNTFQVLVEYMISKGIIPLPLVDPRLAAQQTFMREMLGGKTVGEAHKAAKKNIEQRIV